MILDWRTAALLPAAGSTLLKRQPPANESGLRSVSGGVRFEWGCRRIDFAR
jgi:hypothetical protein